MKVNKNLCKLCLFLTCILILLAICNSKKSELLTYINPTNDKFSNAYIGNSSHLEWPEYIQNQEDCKNACIASNWCNGYTWYIQGGRSDNQALKCKLARLPNIPLLWTQSNDPNQRMIHGFTKTDSPPIDWPTEEETIDIMQPISS